MRYSFLLLLVLMPVLAHAQMVTSPSGRGRVIRVPDPARMDSSNFPSGVALTSVPTESAYLDAQSGIQSAYALRKLYSAYAGNAILVQRSSDDATMAVGFSGDTLDVSSMLSWAGSDSVCVTTWYDQSGGSQNLLANSGCPALIATGGVVKRNTEGLASLHWDGAATDGRYEATLASPVQYDSISLGILLQVETGSDTDIVFALRDIGNWGHETFQLRYQDNTWVHAGSQQTFITSEQGYKIITATSDSLIENTNQWESASGTHSISGFGVSNIVVGGNPKSTSTWGGYITEVIVSHAKGAADRLSLYHSRNAEYGIGPSRWYTNTVLPQILSWHVELYEFLATMSYQNLDILNVGDPSYDGTGTDAEKARMYFLFQSDGDNTNRDIADVFKLNSCWYMLDDGASCGIEATGTVKVPAVYTSGIYDYNGARGIAFWYDLDIPVGGSNPRKGEEGFARRALAIATVNAMQLSVLRNGAWLNHHYFGGYIWDFAVTLDYTWDFLTTEEKQAWEEALIYLMNRGIVIGPNGANSNLDFKGLAGAAIIYPHLGAPGKAVALAYAKKLLFNDVDGSFTVDGWAYKQTDEAITLMPDGNIREGATPESDYYPRSLSHMAEAVAAAKDYPEWSFLNDVFTAAVRFMQSQIAVEPDGSYVGPSGYSGRVPNPVLRGQWTPWALAAIADEYSAPSLLVEKADVTTSVIPSVAAMASDASSKLTSITDITSYSGSSSVNWSNSSPWPADIPFEPVSSDWYTTALGSPWLSAAKDTSYITPIPPDSMGLTDWVAVRLESPQGRAWGALLEGLHWRGGYGATSLGAPMMIWADSIGAFINQMRPGTSTIADDDRPVASLWGTDLGGQTFAFTGSLGSRADSTSRLAKSVDWSAGDSTFTISYVLAERGITGDTLRILDDGTGSTWTLTRRMKVLADGLRITSRYDYDNGGLGTDSISTFYEQIPLFVGNQVETHKLLKWEGDAWSLITPGASANADTLAFVREFSGLEADTVWVYLDDVYPVSFSAGYAMPRNADGTETSSNYNRNMLINLHPTAGAGGEPIPASDSLVYEISVDDPGLVGTAISASMLYPEVGDEMPEGGVLYGKFLVDDGGNTLSSGTYEYKTSAGSWTSAGSLVDNGDGTWQYVGGTIPADLDSIRVVIAPTVGDNDTTTFNVTSTAMTLVLDDPFDGAGSETALDTWTGWTTNTTGNAWAEVLGVVNVTTAGYAQTPQYSSAAKIDVGSVTKLVEAEVDRNSLEQVVLGTIESATIYGGTTVRNESCRLIVEQNVDGNDQLVQGSCTGVASGDVKVTWQHVGDVGVAQIWNTSGVLQDTLVLFDLHYTIESSTGVGFYLRATGQQANYIKVWTPTP